MSRSNPHLDRLRWRWSGRNVTVKDLSSPCCLITLIHSSVASDGPSPGRSIWDFLERVVQGAMPRLDLKMARVQKFKTSTLWTFVYSSQSECIIWIFQHMKPYFVLSKKNPTPRAPNGTPDSAARLPSPAKTRRPANTEGKDPITNSAVKGLWVLNYQILADGNPTCE